MEKYLSVNLSNYDLIHKIRDHIKNKEPFSFTRFGDGEIKHLLKKVPSDWISYYKKTWGFENDEEGLFEIFKIIKKGLDESDVIGIMDSQNEIAKLINYNPEVWSIPNSLINSLEKQVADHQICRSKELGSPEGFKNILCGSPLCIISPRSDFLKKSRLEKLLETSVSFFDIEEGINLKKRGEIIERFDKIKELIVIFGCSVRGKDFAVHLKEKGKIALDFGATLDGWAGIESRGWFKENNIQSHCLIKQHE